MGPRRKDFLSPGGAKEPQPTAQAVGTPRNTDRAPEGRKSPHLAGVTPPADGRQDDRRLRWGRRALHALPGLRWRCAPVLNTSAHGSRRGLRLCRPSGAHGAMCAVFPRLAPWAGALSPLRGSNSVRVASRLAPWAGARRLAPSPLRDLGTPVAPPGLGKPWCCCARHAHTNGSRSSRRLAPTRAAPRREATPRRGCGSRSAAPRSTIASRCSLVLEALGVDLVDVLGARRAGGEPAVRGRRPSGRRWRRRCRGRCVSFAVIGSPASSRAVTASGESFLSLAFCSGVAGASMRV